MYELIARIRSLKGERCGAHYAGQRCQLRRHHDSMHRYHGFSVSSLWADQPGKHPNADYE